MRCNRDNANVRYAFTLFEVLLALALMVLLATALIGAIDLYRRISSTGYAEVEQAQLARAILRNIELDIRACTYQTSEADEETSNESSQDEESEDSVFITEDVAAASIVYGPGLIGDENTLILHVARPPRQVDLFRTSSTDVSAYDPLHELRSVAYFLAATGAEGLPGIAADLFLEQDEEFTTGLARLDGDRFSVAFSDSNQDNVSLMAHTQLLAAEIHFLQFRYFDGVNWQTTWNSEVNEGLPSAVEVSLGFRNRTDGTDSITSSAEIPASQRYRYVVALPGIASVNANTN